MSTNFRRLMTRSEATRKTPSDPTGRPTLMQCERI